jgi:hypothetical protein
MSQYPEEDDIELVPVPMDRETRARLVMLSHIVGDRPTKVAASLLHDLLLEDELFNESHPQTVN